MQQYAMSQAMQQVLSAYGRHAYHQKPCMDTMHLQHSGNTTQLAHMFLQAKLVEDKEDRLLKTTGMDSEQPILQERLAKEEEVVNIVYICTSCVHSMHLHHYRVIIMQTISEEQHIKASRLREEKSQLKVNCVCSNIHLHLPTPAHTYALRHTHTYAYTHKHTQYTDTHTHAHTPSHTHTLDSPSPTVYVAWS